MSQRNPNDPPAPWHRRGAYIALAVACLGWLVLFASFILALGEDLHPVDRAAYEAGKRHLLYVATSLVFAIAAGATTLAVRAIRGQPIAAAVALLLCGPLLIALVAFVWLFFFV